MEKIISAEVVYSGPIFHVEALEVELEDGSPARRDVVVTHGATAVVAVDEAGRVAMVRQYRIPCEREMLEIPAGKLEPGEEPIGGALRELREETGCVASEMQLLTVMQPSVAFLKEPIHIFLAGGLVRGDSALDPEEFLTVEFLPMELLLEAVYRGEIQDAKTVVGLLLAKEALLAVREELDEEEDYEELE